MANESLAADALTRFLAPLTELFALRDGLLVVGSVDEAAKEAQSRLDNANRDTDTARAQLDALTKANAAAVDQAAVIINEAKAEAKDIISTAKVSAANVTAKQVAADTALRDAAVATLADLASQVASQEAALADATTSADQANALADAAHAELTALRAKLGA